MQSEKDEWFIPFLVYIKDWAQVCLAKRADVKQDLGAVCERSRAGSGPGSRLLWSVVPSVGGTLVFDKYTVKLESLGEISHLIE